MIEVVLYFHDWQIHTTKVLHILCEISKEIRLYHPFYDKKSISPNYFKRMKCLIAFSNNIVNIKCDVESFSE